MPVYKWDEYGYSVTGGSIDCTLELMCVMVDSRFTTRMGKSGSGVRPFAGVGIGVSVLSLSSKGDLEISNETHFSMLVDVGVSLMFSRLLGTFGEMRYVVVLPNEEAIATEGILFVSIHVGLVLAF